MALSIPSSFSYSSRLFFLSPPAVLSLVPGAGLSRELGMGVSQVVCLIPYLFLILLTPSCVSWRLEPLSGVQGRAGCAAMGSKYRELGI